MAGNTISDEQRKKLNSIDINEKRSGLMIGIIAKDNIPVQWMFHMMAMHNYIPSGLFWNYGWVRDKYYDEARNSIIEQAKKKGVEWLMFIDTDVFIPQNAIAQLMRHNKKIVSGVYWKKGLPLEPVIYRKFGGGPIFDFEPDQLMPIGGAGLGCCLIHMSVFDELDYPYFKVNWLLPKADGSTTKVNIGEDHYFFYTAKEAGFDTWCDTGVLCDHWDEKSKQYFPGEVFVKEMAEKQLKKGGLQNTIKDQEVNYDFVFYTGNSAAFDGNELEKRGVGGSETSIIYMAKEMARRGYKTAVYCNCQNEGIYDSVIYKHFEKIRELNHARIFISVRDTKILTERPPADKVILWTHDMADSPAWSMIYEAYRAKGFDKIFVLSQFHKRVAMYRFPGIPEFKYYVTSDGINLDHFINSENIEKNKNILLYSSTPFRGLDTLLTIFPKIKEKVPNAELHIYSGMQTYLVNDNPYKDLYDKLLKIDGVKRFEPIKQEELARKHKESYIHVYPSTFPETCCMTVMEAISAGTPIVASHYAALIETVKDCGILIDGDPHTEEYQNKFVDAVVKLMTDENEWNKYHQKCIEKRESLSWTKVADDWVKYLFHTDEKFNVNTPEYWDTVYQKEIEGKTERGDFSRFDIISKEIPENASVIDLGCGTGTFTRWLSTKRPDTRSFGTDFSSYAIEQATLRDRKTEYKVTNVVVNDYPSHTFDVVVAQHILEHLTHPEDLIIEMKRLVKKDGKTILIMPLNDDEWQEHIQVWTEDTLKKFFEQFNLEYTYTVRQEPLRRHPDGRPFEEAIIFIKFKEGKLNKKE